MNRVLGLAALCCLFIGGAHATFLPFHLPIDSATVSASSTLELRRGMGAQYSGYIIQTYNLQCNGAPSIRIATNAGGTVFDTGAVYFWGGYTGSVTGLFNGGFFGFQTTGLAIAPDAFQVSQAYGHNNRVVITSASVVNGTPVYLAARSTGEFLAGGPNLVPAATDYASYYTGSTSPPTGFQIRCDTNPPSSATISGRADLFGISKR